MITSFPILAFLSIIQFLGKKCICSAIRPKNPNMKILIGISNYDWMMLHERIDKALYTAETPCRSHLVHWKFLQVCLCMGKRSCSQDLTWFWYSDPRQLEPFLPLAERQFQIQFDSSQHPSSWYPGDISTLSLGYYHNQFSLWNWRTNWPSFYMMPSWHQLTITIYVKIHAHKIMCIYGISIKKLIEYLSYKCIWPVHLDPHSDGRNMQLEWGVSENDAFFDALKTLQTQCLIECTLVFAEWSIFPTTSLILQ